ncbi:hypothetical protein C9426_16505 [Serratia sp. S1B]|nr:hypothetical protein C9426_16505 [Serratia sp. S1B]
MKKNSLIKKGMISISLLSMPLYAQEETAVEYNPAFFVGTGIDISSFSNGNQLKAGEYDVELYKNGKFIGATVITVVMTGHNQSVIYFDKSVLLQLGFKEEVDEYYNKEVNTDGKIAIAINQFDIKVKFDILTLSVDVIAPQVASKYTPRGYVDPSAWDSGLTAAMINYISNYYHSNTNTGGFSDSYDSFFTGMNIWLNAGRWQFRSYSTVTLGDQKKLSMLRTYIQRDIPGFFSVLQTGEIDTRERFLPATPLLGISLFSDDRMLPDSRRGYVPDIRGIADSNARVTIRQNGNIIYETTVSPGAFLISDLYQASYGGDLNVTIQEADGTQKTFIVPYASLTELLRPRQSKYSVAVGTLNDRSLRKKPFVSSISYHRGLNNYFTGFGGAQLTEHYQSMLTGLAINTTVGAVSTSVALASADLGYDKTQGYNIGLSYSNVIDKLGTSINVATYHYSSSGFSALQDAARARDKYDHNQQVNEYELRSMNQKNSIQLSINQPLGNAGSLYMTAGLNNYWGKVRSANSYLVGYSNQYKNLRYTLSAAKSYNISNNRDEMQYQLGFSFPLGKSASSPTMTTAYTQSSAGDGYALASVTGSLLEDRSLSYGLSTTMATSGEHENFYSGNISKLTPYGNRSASASYKKNTNQYALGMNGSIALHSGGITFGQYTGDTAAIVEAFGATDAVVSGNHNIKVDSRGYAIFPYLSPYRDNEVSLDPNTAASDLEIKNTSQHIAPHAGAIVKLKFDTVYGELRIFEIKYQGENVPLGATAFSNGKMAGMVGGGGILMIRENMKSQIKVIWYDENNSESHCYFNIEKRKEVNSADISKQPVVCI